jgi:hypothetical protein
MISITSSLCKNIITIANLDIKDAHNPKNERNWKTKTPSKQLETRSSKITISLDDSLTPKKLLKDDAFTKVTVHRHHHRPI